MFDETNTSVVSRFDSADGLVHGSQICSHPSLLNNGTVVISMGGDDSSQILT